MKYIKYSLLLLVLIFGYRFYISIGGMCQNKIYKEYISQNKEKKAIIFQRDCGATTGYSTHISIINIDDTLKNESGNVYIIKGIPKKVAPRINWVNGQLIIHKKLTGNEFKSEVSIGLFNTINIVYD